MAPSIDTITSANYYVAVDAGYVIIILGLIGNLICILVFTQLKLFRRNQSAFYLTATLITESFVLIFATSTRVIPTSIGTDPTQLSIVWCKCRAYLAQFATTMIPVIICFAAIDQYLSTSYLPHLQRIGTFKLAEQLVGILVIISALYNIPVGIYNEIRPSLGCSTYNAAFNYFYSFVHLCIIQGIIPIIISSWFSFLSYRNVRRITRRQIPVVRRRLDRQLTAMILVRVALFIAIALPFVTIRSYQLNRYIDVSDKYQTTVDTLIRTTITTFYNFNYSGSFYVFWLTSNRFRRQVKYLFVKKLWSKFLMFKANRNQVVPITGQITAETQSAVEIE